MSRQGGSTGSGSGTSRVRSSGRELVKEFTPSATGKPVKVFPFVERIGLEELLSVRGRAVVRLPLEPNVNHVGGMYAGALCTLAEAPGGSLFLSAFDIKRFYPIVGELCVRYVAPATTSVLVEGLMREEEIERVTAELESTGKSKWEIEQELVDETGKVVATSTATYFGLSR